MKKIFFIIFIQSLFVFSQAQRIYDIIGFRNEYTAAGSEEGMFYPIPMKVFITDTSFYSDGLKLKYTITKKVDSSYFKMTDGIIDFVVVINHNPPRKERLPRKVKSVGYITIEDDKTMMTLYY